MKDDQDIEGNIQYCSVLAKVFQLSKMLRVIYSTDVEENKPPVYTSSQSVSLPVKNNRFGKLNTQDLCVICVLSKHFRFLRCNS